MTTNPATDPATDGVRRSARRFLTVAVGIVAVEAAAYIGFALWGLTDLTAAEAPIAVAIAGFLLAFALAQLLACWQLWRWRSWARGPLVFTQLIVLGLSWGLRDSAEAWLAAVMLVGAVTALVCLLAGPVTRALLDEDGV